MSIAHSLTLHTTLNSILRCHLNSKKKKEYYPSVQETVDSEAETRKSSKCRGLDKGWIEESDLVFLMRFLDKTGWRGTMKQKKLDGDLVNFFTQQFPDPNALNLMFPPVWPALKDSL